MQNIEFDTQKICVATKLINPSIHFLYMDDFDSFYDIKTGRRIESYELGFSKNSFVSHFTSVGEYILPLFKCYPHLTVGLNIVPTILAPEEYNKIMGEKTTRKDLLEFEAKYNKKVQSKNIKRELDFSL